MKKVSELRELSREELNKELRDTRSELVGLRLRKRLGQVENTAQLTLLRRQAARILTLINQSDVRTTVNA